MSGEAKTVSELCREALELVEGASTSGHQNYFEPCEGFSEKIKDAFCGGLDLSIQHDPTIPYRWTTDNEERIVAIFGNGPTSEANQKFHAFAANHIKQIAERCLELEKEVEILKNTNKAKKTHTKNCLDYLGGCICGSIERCSTCGSIDFAVARDMKSTRHCVHCSNNWIPGEAMKGGQGG